MPKLSVPFIAPAVILVISTEALEFSIPAALDPPLAVAVESVMVAVI